MKRVLRPHSVKGKTRTEIWRMRTLTLVAVVMLISLFMMLGEVTAQDTGQLTVTKVVWKDNGGTAIVPDFTLTVSNSTWSGVVVSGVQNVFDVGDYVVSETGPTGYAAAFSGDCDADGKVTLAVGEDKTCTITNDDIGPKLTVTKLVVNDNGGTKVIVDFPLFVDVTSVVSGVQNVFDAGDYVVSETGQAGYTSAITGDCAADGSITLALDDVKACTITNDDIGPKLTVTKVVVNDDGGTKVVSEFPLFVDSNPVTSGVQVTLSAGSHTVSETGLATYAATIGGDCAADGSITLAPGDVKTCTVTNDDIPAPPPRPVVPVGGEVYAVNRFAVLAPYLALLGLVGAVIALFGIKRTRQA